MSRFIEVLNEHGSVIHIDNIREILEHLQMRLNAKQAHVEFEFPFFIEKRAPVTGAVGLMDYITFKLVRPLRILWLCSTQSRNSTESNSA